MDKELKQKWVSALRSGKYKQTTETLNDCGGGFCCLGVLLDVSGAGEWNDSSFILGEYDGTHRHTLDGDLGFRGRELFSIPEPDEANLIVMNDEKGCTFEEIADYIEAKL